MSLYPARALRVMRIVMTLSRYRLDELTRAAHWFRPLTWMVPGKRGIAQHSPGARLRMAMQELGPVFVKFGQVLSTRRDLLPPEIADELALLQDQVQAFPGEQAQAIIEAELKAPVAEIFAAFDIEPLASASIAQVHAAELKDGSKVVVKVVRPGIRKRIGHDIALLESLAAMAQKYHPEGQRIRPVEIVNEFKTFIFDELNMQREAANASLLRRYHENSTELYIPRMHWSYCSERILTMERVYGINIRDKQALLDHGVDLQALASRCIRVFYVQVFRDNLFHADMHPGNLLVSTEHPHDPQLIALDFGIVASLPAKDLYYIGENFTAMFEQNYRRVAELHIEAGWLPADTRVDEMEASVRTLCEANFTRPLSEVSFGQLLLQLFQVARRYKLTIQPQLIMLQKTLLNIEGLARDLYPQLDMWAIAKPELARIIEVRRGPTATLRQLRRRLPRLLETTPEMPELIHQTMRNLAHGELRITQRDPATAQLPELLRRWRRSSISAILGASLLVVGTLLLDHQPQAELLNIGWSTWLCWLAGLSAFMLAWRQ
ncbi:MAG: ubiquinone biosynthesis regulatory protein kinase UbiB [Gammaproteobacteria bacterium]|nr:ubiquinone biosynthesis regulatory protein kinase UbiB [Gammaproteobacteria bacterium]